MKKVPTWFLGVCYVIQFNSVEKWTKKISHSFYVLHKKSLDTKDIPKSFHIYMTPKHEWMGIVKENWIGTQAEYIHWDSKLWCLLLALSNWFELVYKMFSLKLYNQVPSLSLSRWRTLILEKVMTGWVPRCIKL